MIANHNMKSAPCEGILDKTKEVAGKSTVHNLLTVGVKVLALENAVVVGVLQYIF